jgi:hypothetical protein
MGKTLLINYITYVGKMHVAHQRSWEVTSIIGFIHHGYTFDSLDSKHHIMEIKGHDMKQIC